MSATLPEHTPTVAAIYAAYEAKQDGGLRPHLGASIIGGPCDRAIFYAHRWADTKTFDGRMLRLFDTGNHAEDRFVKDLRRIGCQVMDVDPATGRQWSVSALNGHFRGSADGVAVGIPEAPATYHLLEFKTHSAKSFAELKSKGVLIAKPAHFAQMQAYMGLLDLERALYLAVNKDTDELYSERLHFSRADFDAIMARADRIIRAEAPPERISDDPSWYQCKFCDFQAVCHEGKPALKTCRSCAFAAPVVEGEDQTGAWSCDKWKDRIPPEHQRTGCDAHEYATGMEGRIITPPAAWEPPVAAESVQAEQPPAAVAPDAPEAAPLPKVTKKVQSVIRRMVVERPDAHVSDVRNEIIAQCGARADAKLTDAHIAALMAEAVMQEAAPDANAPAISE